MSTSSFLVTSWSSHARVPLFPRSIIELLSSNRKIRRNRIEDRYNHQYQFSRWISNNKTKPSREVLAVDDKAPEKKMILPSDGKTLQYFLSQSTKKHEHKEEISSIQSPSKPIIGMDEEEEEIFFSNSHLPLNNRTYFIETYGCQMNTSDSEIVESVLQLAGLTVASSVSDADVILINTCAIREGAESKVWRRLESIRAEHKKKKLIARHSIPPNHYQQPLIAILGCMSTRLKERWLENKKIKVDIVCGPDSYRHLPLLIQAGLAGKSSVSVQLSVDETYADISPIRTSPPLAYVSIMRGCDNMCSYCIVPFTRGRERSRHYQSVIEEVQRLSEEGYKEITLLGQNVNSYNITDKSQLQPTRQAKSRGFINISKRSIEGFDFTSLLDQLSLINEEVRFRFTSPHPKDFPDDLIYLIAERNNICNQIHIPAQSGSTAVLERMRRGYTRESYLSLVKLMRRIIPNVSLSSDFIAGFCGETEEDHLDTLSLMKEVKFDQAFMFAYSQREKTHAYRSMADDVPEEIKGRRLKEIIQTFHNVASEITLSAIGSIQLVLVEGPSRRTSDGGNIWLGRTDSNRRAHFQYTKLPYYSSVISSSSSSIFPSDSSAELIRSPLVGDYVAVEITSVSTVSYQARALGLTTLSEYFRFHPFLSEEQKISRKVIGPEIPKMVYSHQAM